MTEAFSSFRSEILRPLAMLALPGGIGGAPWFVMIVENQATLKSLAKANHTETVIAFVLFALFCGLIFQDKGATLESEWDNLKDKEDEGAKPPRKEGDHLRNWYTYLCSPTKDELIAHRYIRDFVWNFKFELGQYFSCLYAIVGLGLLQAVRLFNGGFVFNTFLWSVLVGIVLWIIGSYLCKQAKISHQVLARLRTEMITRSSKALASSLPEKEVRFTIVGKIET